MDLIEATKLAFQDTQYHVTFSISSNIVSVVDLDIADSQGSHDFASQRLLQLEWNL